MCSWKAQEVLEYRIGMMVAESTQADGLHVISEFTKLQRCIMDCYTGGLVDYSQRENRRYLLHIIVLLLSMEYA